MTTYFTKDHEWVRIEGDLAVTGITAYAVAQLGDVVFVELPKVGASVTQGAQMAVVESVKAASDVYAPASGEVVAVNDALVASPEMANAAPEGDAWFVKLRLSAPAELDAMMDRAAYDAFVATL